MKYFLQPKDNMTVLELLEFVVLAISRNDSMTFDKVSMEESTYETISEGLKRHFIGKEPY